MACYDGGHWKKVLMPRVFLLLLLATLLPLPLSAQALFLFVADDQTVPFHPTNGIAEVTVDLSIVEDPQSPGFPTQTDTGFAMAFTVDASLLDVVEVAPTGPWVTICGPTWDAFLVTTDPAGCPGGVSIGVVYGFLCDVFITFENQTPMVAVTFEAVPTALIGTTQPVDTQLTWTNGCGIDNQLGSGGVVISPSFVDGTITFSQIDLEPFRRGDCNADGAIDIADSMAILAWLFLASAPPPCPLSCDVNGDGGAVDIADAVYLLTYLFSSGAPPALPFPDCGTVAGTTPADCPGFGVCP